MTERVKTAWAASGRITGLDGLRAVSLLLFLCGHARPERTEGFAAVRSPACHWPVNALLALACAIVSHSPIERPFLRLKDRVSRSAPGHTGRPRIACGAGGTDRAGRWSWAISG